MSFKAKKLNIDLELDLTEYIPEAEGGILKTDKIDVKSINDWQDMAIDEGQKLIEYEKEYYETKVLDNGETIKILKDDVILPLKEIRELSKKSVIKQIDYFYNKGEKFYKKIPVSVMNDILKYINEQISPVKKK